MLNLGILGCSEIADKRFMPAVLKSANIRVVAVAEEYDKTKLKPFSEKFHIEPEKDFETLLKREDIAAVYIPQPPAMHYPWAQCALENEKHVLIEKPSTTTYANTLNLVMMASEKHLALHENYMFQYHSQLKKVQELLSEGRIGDIRLIKMDFGFPLRSRNDFRYSQNMGGGALLDAGGYTLKLATILLGETIKVDAASLNYIDEYEVEMYGSATLSNETGVVCHTGFGMDCAYRCSLEVWGNQGYLNTDRIFTAPPGYKPTIQIHTANGIQILPLEEDDHFLHSIEHFCEEISNDIKREKMYRDMLLQARLVDTVRNMGKHNAINKG